MKIQVRILGSGTSTGVPVIGCDCAVCTSSNPKNRRLRSAVLITRQDTNENLLIDTSPDLRWQMLSAGIRSVSKVLWTHTHADHCHGFDDLRTFCFRREYPIDGYLQQSHRQELEQRFAYTFAPKGDYLGALPQINLHTIQDGEIFYPWPDFPVECVSFPHGGTQSSGYRFGCFAFVTDFQYFPPSVMSRWKERLHTLVASGLHDAPHHAHSSIPQTLEIFRQLNVQHGIITHTSHKVDYERRSASLPENVELAYDGMSFYEDIF